MIQVKTIDGDIFKLEHNESMYSELLTSFIEDADDSDSDPILLKNVDTLQFEKILVFIKHINESISKEKDCKLIKDSLYMSSIPLWYREYASLDSTKDYVELLKASDYMQIDSLIQLLCCKFASLLKEKTADEIEEMMNY